MEPFGTQPSVGQFGPVPNQTAPTFSLTPFAPNWSGSKSDQPGSGFRTQPNPFFPPRRHSGRDRTGQPGRFRIDPTHPDRFRDSRAVPSPIPIPNCGTTAELRDLLAANVFIDQGRRLGARKRSDTHRVLCASCVGASPPVRPTCLSAGRSDLKPEPQPPGEAGELACEFRVSNPTGSVPNENPDRLPVSGVRNRSEPGLGG